MGKKRELMQQAVHLFSIKGFHQTSVQEIAQAAGISKGAFYKHFDSKESILIGILRQHHEDALAQTNAPSFSEELDGKETFTKKLAFEMERILENKDFYVMVFKDMPTDGNEPLTSLLEELRISSTELHKNSILEAYGPVVQPFLADLVKVLEGIMREYLITMVLENKQFSVARLTGFISSCIDAIVRQLNHMEPVYTEEAAASLSVEDRLAAVEKKISILPSNQEKLLSSLNLLKQELKKEQPETFLVEALTAYLKQEKRIQQEVLLLEKNI